MSQDFLKNLLGTSQPEPIPDPRPTREQVVEIVSAAYERNKSLLADQRKHAESYAVLFDRLAKLLRDDPEKLLDSPESLDSYPTLDQLRHLAEEFYDVRINLAPLELVLRGGRTDGVTGSTRRSIDVGSCSGRRLWDEASHHQDKAIRKDCPQMNADSRRSGIPEFRGDAGGPGSIENTRREKR